MDLAEIAKMLDEIGPPSPEPFNGATTILLARDVFDTLNCELERYCVNPFIKPKVKVIVSPNLPMGHGAGFRSWRNGDDPDLKFDGDTVLVWTVAPQSGA